ncbi:putative membrane protein, putative permease (EamA domain), type 1 [Campylobacter iguaniorum]|uniref:DMT family transporter n=1 Tax=Campylobacter iguaniorum TaxID=1244531 RepID=UPI00073A1DAE|nr:DMT family transporter [Campylobacter iguaniorum]ALV25098.1 putative membrane protein, putative permease (EamA domain), type 1 [Campylobacter iguaniorum]
MYRSFLMRHLGIYYMLIASLLFAATGAFAKLLSSDMSSIEVVFFRNAIGFVLILFALGKKPLHQKGGRPFVLIFRGVIGTLGLLAFFYNVAQINLATAFTFQKTAPIFTAIIAMFLFQEKLSKLGWIAIFIGFIGIVFIVQPNLGLNKNDLVGLLSGVGAAMAYTSIRELRKYYDTRIIVLSFMTFGTFIPLLCMVVGEFYSPANLDFIFSKFAMPNLTGFIYIAFMGVCGAWFQIYLTKAYAASRKAGVVAAVSYSDVLFSMLFGLLLGDSLPNWAAMCGICLIVVSGILIAKEK